MVNHDDRQVLSIRGDKEDVFAGGYLCPKATSLGALHTIRTGSASRWSSVTASSTRPLGRGVSMIDQRLTPLREAHGPDAVAVYFGNPSAHNLSGALYLRVLAKALATKNIYSAGSVDQIPKSSSAATSTATRRPSRSPISTAPTTC